MIRLFHKSDHNTVSPDSTISNQNKFVTFDTSAYTAGRRSTSNFTLDGIAPFLAISSLTKMQLNRIHVVTVCLYKHKKIQRRAKISSFGSLASTISHSVSV